MMARSLDANGASQVYIIGRRFEKLQKVALEAKNKCIIPVQGDVTSKHDLGSIAARIEAEVGYVNGNVLYNGSRSIR